MRIIERSFYENMPKPELKELIRQQLKELKLHMLSIATACDRILDLPQDKREEVRKHLKEESKKMDSYIKNIEEMRLYLRTLNDKTPKERSK